jgi:hypothetical protein
LDLLCQQWTSLGFFWSSGLFSRESGSSPLGLGAAVATTGICVSKSAFGPGSIVTAGPKSERRKEQARAGSPGAGKSLGTALGRDSASGEVST